MKAGRAGQCRGGGQVAVRPQPDAVAGRVGGERLDQRGAVATSAVRGVHDKLAAHVARAGVIGVIGRIEVRVAGDRVVG